MKVRFKKLAAEAVEPTYANAGDAGLDLVATRFTQEFDKSGKMVLVYHTDLAVEIPEGYVGLVFQRSSIAERSLMLTNCVGIIDAGYRGEITGKFKLTTDAIPTIYQPGEKVMQMVIMPFPMIEVEMSEELSEGSRGENGYGSSDRVKEEVRDENAPQGRDSGETEGDNQSVQS